MSPGPPSPSSARPAPASPPSSRRASTAGPARLPGAELLTPLPLAALAAMAVNDHLLRARFPGWITGKLSDVAVVLFFPFLITATISWGIWLTAPIYRRLRGRSPPWPLGLTRARLVIGLAITAVALAGLNLSTDVRDLYVAGLDALDPFGWLGPFRYTTDPSDCLALLALPLAGWWGARLCRRP